MRPWFPRNERPDPIDHVLIDQVRKDQPEFVRNARMEYLKSEILRLEKDRDEWVALGEKNSDDPDTTHLIWVAIRDLREKITSLKAELGRLRKQSETQGLSDADIQLAREFPITRLLDKKPGDHIVCPGHEDKDPSLRIYQDHVHCFVCGFHADSIDWLKKTQGLFFMDAVKALS